ncbi:transketolase [Saccharothrix algeriensis]|uniref:Transketolase n=1 Tax=Saccharothrix algeriensis TaxID=173560 RepID=A0A8T8HVY9_9PSEU|nr:transketolase [Saccharothrix algeriensis]MBM7814454.1 transketolase [Saccharothrix algeriensis]QTR02753.1 transketolase [Saccharothrix algeriensis]
MSTANDVRADVELAVRAMGYRMDVIDLIRSAGNGHMAGSLSCLDILTVLYERVLRISPDTLRHPERDRYVQSKGHAVEALYVVLAGAGLLDRALLDTYLRFGTDLVGHATRSVPGIEQSTGALGHGLSLGVGMAIAGKQNRLDYRVFVLMGDGEIAEGSVWEAAMSASHYDLDNLVAIVDRNRYQIAGSTAEILDSEPLSDKFTSFGWNVHEIDGHDLALVEHTLSSAPTVPGRPTMVLADTVKGSGISYMEHNIRWHHRVPNDEEYAIARQDVDNRIAELRSRA